MKNKNVAAAVEARKSPVALLVSLDNLKGLFLAHLGKRALVVVGYNDFVVPRARLNFVGTNLGGDATIVAVKKRVLVLNYLNPPILS